MKKYFILIITLFTLTAVKGQWTQVSTVGGYGWTLFFTSADTGYLGVGQSPGGILKTINGGFNWNSQWTQTLYNITSITFVNTDTGYAVGYIGSVGGLILKTLDKGANWSTKYTVSTAVGFESIFFVNADTGYVVGDNIILKTIDGGNNWTTQSPGVSSQLYSVFFLNADTGYAAGSDNVILKTINGGTNWTLLTSPISIYGFNSMYFLNADTGFVVGSKYVMTTQYSYMLKTTNGGTSWSSVSSGLSWPLNSIYFPTRDTGYCVGSGITKTINGGLTWTVQSLGTGASYNSVYFPNAYTGYVTGFGTVLKTTNGGIVWVEEYSVNNSDKVYPNPTKDFFNVTIDEPFQTGEIIIYNSLGSKVKYQKLNSQTTKINRNGLSDGLYFYQVTDDNGILMTGKLMIE